MSHLLYYNTVVDINERMYDSHKELIGFICNELGQPQRAKEFIDKYLDEKTVLSTKRDKNHPKRPKSSFLFFMSTMRPIVTAKFEKITIGELGKEFGKLWKALTPEEKVQYEDLAKADKTRYLAELENYKQAMFQMETGN